MCVYIVIHKYIHNYMNRAFPPTMTAQLRINSESFGSSACDQGDDLAVDIPWCRAVPLQKAACTGDASATGHSWAVRGPLDLQDKSRRLHHMFDTCYK